MLRFSKKSFLIAFIAALILFSGIMAIVCYHAFSGHVFVHRDEVVDQEEGICVTDPKIYYCLDPDSGVLEYSVLVFRDAVSGETFLMHLTGEWLVTYRDALYYVRSLYAADPEGSLGMLYSGLTGAEIETDALIDARSLLPESKKTSHLRYSALAELLSAQMQTDIQEILPVFVGQEEYRHVDVAKTRRLFGAEEK